jgi:hypothetical protein
MKKKISSEEKETLRKFSQRKNYLLYHWRSKVRLDKVRLSEVRLG